MRSLKLNAQIIPNNARKFIFGTFTVSARISSDQGPNLISPYDASFRLQFNQVRQQ